MRLRCVRRPVDRAVGATAAAHKRAHRCRPHPSRVVVPDQAAEVSLVEQIAAERGGTVVTGRLATRLPTGLGGLRRW